MEEKSIKINVPEGYEVDEVNSSFSEIKFKPIESKDPKSWEDAFIGKDIDGFWIDEDSSIKDAICEADSEDCNVFKTKKQAKAMLAYAQITQLMALPCYNGNWVPDFNDNSMKYIIYRNNEYICKTEFSSSCHKVYCKVVFENKAACDAFYYNHMDLLKTYFELD